MPVGNRAARKNLSGGQCWLSVCVPAYEHPEGILKILREVHQQGVQGLEVIISDDSHSDLVESVVKNHPAYQYMNIKYVRNSPSLGAIDNWNSLLKMSKGDYLMLMHHDEAPFTEGFFKDLHRKIKDFQHVDVFVLDCFVKKGPYGFCFRHMPVEMKKLIFEINPLYLLRHNIFGPTSVLLFKRCMKRTFDSDLKWLVDVDWVLRLLSGQDVSIKFLKDVSIISEVHSGSITNKIHSDIPMLTRSESRIIQRKMGKNSMIFRMIEPCNYFDRLLAYFDFVAWRLFRLIYISFNVVSVILKRMGLK